MVLLVRVALNAVLAALLAYQPLDLASRSEHAAAPVPSASLLSALRCWGSWVLGLVAMIVLLMWRPAVVAESRSALVTASLLLGASLVIRGVSERSGSSSSRLC